MFSNTSILQQNDKYTKRLLGYEVKEETKKTKAVRPFDSKYWAKHGEISDLRLKRSKLSLRILRNELKDESGWKGNEEVTRAQEEEHIYSLEAEIFKKQASRVEPNRSDEEKPQRILHAIVEKWYRRARIHR